MDLSRLEVLSSDLASKLRRAPTAKQRAACLVACEIAVAKSNIKHRLVDEVLRQLHAGRILVPQKKVALEALASQLDEEYLNLQKAAEVGKATKSDYLTVFAKARAVAALSFAISEELEAVADAVYEAATAVGDDQEGFFELIQRALQ